MPLRRGGEAGARRSRGTICAGVGKDGWCCTRAGKQVRQWPLHGAGKEEPSRAGASLRAVSKKR